MAYFAWPAGLQDNSQAEPASASNESKKPAAAINTQQYPTDEASSLWVVVNKGRALPSSYVPKNLVVPDVPLRLAPAAQEMHLRAEAASALEAMYGAALKDGVKLMLASGYRSYTQQEAVYSAYVARSGVTQADTYSARPGHSEHQTGLAADLEPASRVCEVDDCFADTPEGKWLAANCYKYGFIIRYQKDAQNLTGYIYEPWHVRYVGDILSQALNKSGQTLEQYFNLPVSIDYSANVVELKGS